MKTKWFVAVVFALLAGGIAIAQTPAGGYSSPSSGSGGLTQGPLVISAASYGVKANWKKVGDATVTNTSPLVTLSASDPPFTPADTGALCWGTNGGGGVLAFGSTSSIPTLTYVSPTTANCGSTNAAFSTTNVPFYWGTDDTNAWAAVLTALQALPVNSYVEIQLPCGMTDMTANLGFSLTNKLLIIVTGCTGGSSPSTIVIPPTYNISASDVNGMPFGETSPLGSGTCTLSFTDFNLDFGSFNWNGKGAQIITGIINNTPICTNNIYSRAGVTKNLTVCCGMVGASLGGPLFGPTATGGVSTGGVIFDNVIVSGWGPSTGIPAFVYTGLLVVTNSVFNGNFNQIFNAEGNTYSSNNFFNSTYGSGPAVFTNLTNIQFTSINDRYNGNHKLLSCASTGCTFWGYNVRHTGSYSATGLNVTAGTANINLTQSEYSGISVAGSTTMNITQDPFTANAGSTNNSGTLLVHHTETGTCIFASGTTCAVTFAQTFGSGTPVVTILPINPASTTFTVNAAPTATGFTITASGTNSLSVQWTATE